MNKKRLLLSTAITATMLVSGIAMPISLATTEADANNNTATLQLNGNAYTITIALPRTS